jgi:hypothetical protein
VNAALPGIAWFRGATFSGHAGFDSATFINDSAFGAAKFASSALFHEAKFADVGFNNIDAVPSTERLRCWVRADVPERVVRSRIWPEGWTVRPPDEHRPDDHHEGQWGHLMYTPPDTSLGTNQLVEAGDALATGGTPAVSEPEPTTEALRWPSRSA